MNRKQQFPLHAGGCRVAGGVRIPRGLLIAPSVDVLLNGSKVRIAVLLGLLDGRIVEGQGAQGPRMLLHEDERRIGQEVDPLRRAVVGLVSCGLDDNPPLP